MDKTDNDLLNDAAEKGDLHTVQNLLAAGVNPHTYEDSALRNVRRLIVNDDQWFRLRNRESGAVSRNVSVGCLSRQKT